MPVLEPIVAVPARNEEDRLPGLLEALALQTGLSTTLKVIIVLNNTTDQSGAVATKSSDRFNTLDIDILDVCFPAEQAHVGSARKLAMDRATTVFRHQENGVILTTDADAVPAKDWVERNLLAIAKGADVVGGKLHALPDEQELLGSQVARRAAIIATYKKLCDELESLIDPIEYDPWPRHQDHTGGSLAVRCDAYLKLGGLNPLPTREDLDLVHRARKFGLIVAHPLDVSVSVSARTEGRASGGMAECLRQWMDDELHNRPILVEAAKSIELRSSFRKALRGLLCDQPQSGLLPYLIHTLAPDQPDPRPTTPVELAMSEIRSLIELYARTKDVA